MTIHSKNWYLCVLAAALLRFGIGSADAVNVNPDGLGQVLLFPYYSARSTDGSANYTVIAVTNTTAKAKAIGMSFFEGKAGSQVLGFNVFLLPGATWKGAVLPSGSGGAQLITYSSACSAAGIAPPPPSGVLDPGPPRIAPGVPANFRNFSYAADPLGSSLERTLEGNVVVIEEATYAAASSTVAAISSPTCAIDYLTASSEAQAVAGGLMGHAEIANVLLSQAFDAAPTVLQNFRTAGKYELPGTVKPDLRDVSPPIAVRASTSGMLTASGFVQDVDAVSAVLMQESVLNGFVSDPAVDGATDWILTFPTKPRYFGGNDAMYLFQRDLGAGGACDDIGVGVNVAATDAVAGAVCWATNAVTFNGANVLGSANSFSVATETAGSWASIKFVAPPGTALHRMYAQSSLFYLATTGATASGGTVVFTGLPVIGFAATRVSSGLLGIPDGVLLATDTTTSAHKFFDSYSLVILTAQ